MAGSYRSLRNCDLVRALAICGAVGQISRQHLIGDHAQREHVGARRAAFAEEIFRRGVLHGAQNVVVACGWRGFGHAGDFGGTEIDDLHGAGLVDHDVFRPQILVQHLHPVKGAQALGDLLDDAAHRFQIRLWIVDHPLGQGLPVDEFGHDIEEVALAGMRKRFQYMRAVDAPGDPLLHHESLQIGRIVAQVDRRNLDGDQRIGFGIDREIDVASAAGVQFPDDSVAVEHHPRVQQRRQRQFGRWPENLAGLAIRQFVDADDLDGEVVRAALPVGLLDDRLCGLVQIVGVVIDRLGDKTVADMFVSAVGREQEDVAFFDLDRLVVDFDLGIDPQCAAQIALLGRNNDPMVVGELLQRVAGQPVDSGIADVEIDARSST